MNILLRFIKFWYPGALIVFIRFWRNLLQVIEEDLALGLMFKLLLTPLFHDASIIGRLLSFGFRVSRIFFGLFAYLATSIFTIFLALAWFLSPLLFPLLLIANTLNIDFSANFQILGPTLGFLLNSSAFILLTGISIFIEQLIYNPPKKLWQIKDPKQIWQVTKLTPKNIDFAKLLHSDEVIDLLNNLEMNYHGFQATVSSRKFFLGGLHPGSKAPGFRHAEIRIENLASLKAQLNEEVLTETLNLAKKAQARFITEGYFFVALLSQVPGIEAELLKLKLNLDNFHQALSFLEFKKRHFRKVFVWDEDFAVKHLKGVNRGWLGVPTPRLDEISEDLTKAAAKTGFNEFVGRVATLNQVMTILSQPQDKNVLLVGPPGAGKSALINNLAKNIVAGDASSALATKRLLKIDISKLLAGIEAEGDLAQVLKQIFAEVEYSGNIILFIDEFHELGLGYVGDNLNLYSLLLPYLESNKFQFLATTEPDNFVKVLESHGNFIRIFNKVELAPATAQETREILFEKAVTLQRKEKIKLTFLAIKEIVELAAKLIHNRVLPDSALFVLQECQVRAVAGWITRQVVEGVFSQETNVPVGELNASQKTELLDLEKVIHERLIDQEEAVKKVADALRRGATALREEDRPIGSFLFVGPTGVGKTELAKTLAESYFKSKNAFWRFDMSEYQTEATIDHLTEVVKNKPYALILLDEFEKASPAVLNLFLQVLDDGRLTDSRGQTVDFTNTIIIATSNAGSLDIVDGVKQGLSFKEIESQVRYEILKVFKPELVNRFDEVVVFKPLSETDLEKIVIGKLNELQKKLREGGYLVEFNPVVISELGKKGFDPILGARPLKRLIQDTLESNLSKLILEEKIKKGESFKAGVELLG